jgi:hypothetical protein
MADRLRALWDFGDLDTTERRLHEQLAREATSATPRCDSPAWRRGLRGDVDATERPIVESAV